MAVEGKLNKLRSIDDVLYQKQDMQMMQKNDLMIEMKSIPGEHSCKNEEGEANPRPYLKREPRHQPPKTKASFNNVFGS